MAKSDQKSSRKPKPTYHLHSTKSKTMPIIELSASNYETNRTNNNNNNNNNNNTYTIPYTCCWWDPGTTTTHYLLL